MNLKQKLIQEVMQEAGRKIASIDANAGLIDEAETLSKALRGACPEAEYTGSPVVTPHEKSVTALVQFAYLRRSAVLAAIERAGLQVAGERPDPDGSGGLYIDVAGFSVPLLLVGICEELAEAA